MIRFYFDEDSSECALMDALRARGLELNAHRRRGSGIEDGIAGWRLPQYNRGWRRIRRWEGTDISEW
jgi:hypothetical protein